MHHQHKFNNGHIEYELVQKIIFKLIINVLLLLTLLNNKYQQIIIQKSKMTQEIYSDDPDDPNNENSLNVYSNPQNKDYLNDLHYQRQRCNKNIKEIFKLKQKSFLQQLQNIRLKKETKNLQEYKKQNKEIIEININMKKQLSKFKELYELDVLQLQSEIEFTKNQNCDLNHKITELNLRLNQKDIQLKVLLSKFNILQTSLTKTEQELHHAKIKNISYQNKFRLFEQNIVHISNLCQNSNIPKVIDDQYVQILNYYFQTCEDLKKQLSRVKQQNNSMSNKTIEMQSQISQFQPTRLKNQLLKQQNKKLHKIIQQKIELYYQAQAQWQQKYLQQIAIETNKIKQYYEKNINKQKESVKILVQLLKSKKQMQIEQGSGHTANQLIQQHSIQIQ